MNLYRKKYIRGPSLIYRAGLPTGLKLILLSSLSSSIHENRVFAIIESESSMKNTKSRYSFMYPAYIVYQLQVSSKNNRFSRILILYPFVLIPRIPAAPEEVH